MSDAGRHMQAEIAEAPAAFVRAVSAKVDSAALAAGNIAGVRAFYTLARGSSVAAANILSYAFMRETGKPMPSLPPSIFSVGRGVDMSDAASNIVSQSGASDDLVRSAKGASAAGGVVIGIVNQPDLAVESAAATPLLRYLCYPLVLATSLALGHDPYHPANLSKVTQTT